MGPGVSANQLFKAGKLDDAIDVLSADLRGDPTNTRARTFLFELLCFGGQHERAEKQLDVLAEGSREAEMGALLFRSALHADRVRQEMFAREQLPDGKPPPAPVSGTLNGTVFGNLTDGDPRLGARLEIYAAGQYTWLPLEHIQTVRMEPPKKLRDLLWAPAVIVPGPAFQGMELGEVLIPVLTPLSARHEDDQVRLGRLTVWGDLPSGEQAPTGLKLLLVDEEEFPILELRELEITRPTDQPA